MKAFLVFATLLLTSTLFADVEREAADAIRAHLSESGISQDQIQKAISSGLWRDDKNALAIAIPSKEQTICLVFIRFLDGKNKVVDVSKVESGNFGKLGFCRSHYERFETRPVKWYTRKDYYLIEFRTRAWRGGQRFTTAEPLLISLAGEPIWR